MRIPRKLIFFLASLLTTSLAAQHTLSYASMYKGGTECLIDDNVHEIIPSGKYINIWTAYHKEPKIVGGDRIEIL